MPIISIIAAIDNNNAIGKNNQLLWHLPADLKRFKRITMGHTIIMGKKTFDSLPLHPLPGRINIVLSHKEEEYFDNIITAYSIDDVFKKCDQTNENFIIGGGSVYKQFFCFVQKLYITKVHAVFEADTFFPIIDPNIWNVVESEEMMQDERNAYPYTFITYQKK